MLQSMGSQRVGHDWATEQQLLQGGSQFRLHVGNCFFDLLFIAFISIITLRGLPGGPCPLLDCKLKCLGSAGGEIVCLCPPVNRRD